MSIENMVNIIKKIHPNYVAIIKIGAFYNSYGKDAYIKQQRNQYQDKGHQQKTQDTTETQCMKHQIPVQRGTMITRTFLFLTLRFSYVVALATLNLVPVCSVSTTTTVSAKTSSVFELSCPYFNVTSNKI